MKLNDLVKLAQKKLPLYTDKFSKKIAVTNLSGEANSTICTLSTGTVEHGLEVGEEFIINGAKRENKIVSLTQNHGLGRLVTEFAHQVTKNTPLRAGDSTHITIQGANEEAYNGTFLIMDIPNANVIEFDISSSAPTEATGKPILAEDTYSNYNGRHIVKTVEDKYTITFETDRVPDTATPIGDIFIRTGVRISGEYSIDHCIEAYEAVGNDELWGFCVLNGANVSKSRVNKSDAIATAELGTDIRIELIQDFDFFIIIPTTSEYCWIDFVDLAQDLRKAVLKVFHRAKVDSGVTDNDAYLAFVGDQPVDTTTKAFMIYQYKFQTTINIQNLDGIEPDFTPAIREFEMHHKDNLGTEDAYNIDSYADIPDELLELELDT